MKEGTKLILIIAGILLLALLMAYPTVWLWNALMPKIFGLIEINFWQALGVNILSGILFRTNSNYSSNK